MTRTRWMMEGEPSDKEIRSEVMRLLMLSGKGKSICPTEVARSLFHPWRNKVDRVLEVVAQMAVYHGVLSLDWMRLSSCSVIKWSTSKRFQVRYGSNSLKNNNGRSRVRS